MRRENSESIKINSRQYEDMFNNAFALLVTIAFASGISDSEFRRIKDILNETNIGYMFCCSFGEFHIRKLNMSGEYFAFIHNGNIDNYNRPIYIVYSSRNLPPECFDLAKIREGHIG
jgi:hypothetical protein